MFDSLKWMEHSRPFRHFRAEAVLDPPAYTSFTKNFEHWTAQCPEDYYAGAANYDAKILTIRPEWHSVIPFLNCNFLQSLAEFLKLPFVARTDAAFHSHPVGSRTGWVHTDHCPAWFHEPATETEGLGVPDRRVCDYFTGEPLCAGANPVAYARAATAIFYFGNDQWQARDGGETELSSTQKLGPRTETDLVPPRSNSLIVFECSPHSYHRFIGNNLFERKSFIFWLHDTLASTKERWGNSIFD